MSGVQTVQVMGEDADMRVDRWFENIIRASVMAVSKNCCGPARSGSTESG